MPQPATAAVAFPALGPAPLDVDFLGGRLTSDGGLPWLAEADTALELTATLAAEIPDWRLRRAAATTWPRWSPTPATLPAAA